MISFLLDQLRSSKYTQVITSVFTIFLVWWVAIFIRGLTESPENTYFTISYCLIALLGGIFGLTYAQKWGGFKSTLGSSIMYFSLGLLMQFIGQLFYNSYIYFLGIELPYPSVGDVAFLGSVVFYIMAVIQLAKVSGMKLSVKTFSGRIQAILIPLAILGFSYWYFLNGYEPDWSNWIVIFLDFVFPIGQAVFLSIAILALLISKDILGGMMRKPILLLLFALVVQYLADFHFSYEASREIWYAGGWNDLIFAFAYFTMALSLTAIGNMFYKVKDS